MGHRREEEDEEEEEEEREIQWLRGQQYCG